MRKLVAVALLLCFALPMMAQNKKEEARVQLAREKYAEGLANIAAVKQYEADDIPAVNYTTVVRKQNWAGAVLVYALRLCQGRDGGVAWLL